MPSPEVAIKIASFFAQYSVRRYKKGQLLIHAGDDPDCIYQLVTGKVKQYDLTYRGDEVILNVFKPPAFFPMAFAINRTPNTYFYEAEADIEARKAPIEDVLEFVRNNPDVLYDLLARVYRGADGLLRRMAHLMASSARSRVMYELIIECRRFSEETNAGYAVNLNESDLAARAGLSRETVSREAHKLKEAGLISIVNKQIYVPELERLERSLGEDL